MAKKYWLMKSEPDVFSWDDLVQSPDATTCWEGVRNYQARNLMRDEMKIGDGVFFYHSNTKPQAIMGTAKVVKTAYPDPYQFDPESKYYDEKSDPETPRWLLVDIQADKAFHTPVTLHEMKAMPELDGMMLLKKGSRLSVQPVLPEHWKYIVALGRRKS